MNYYFYLFFYFTPQEFHFHPNLHAAPSRGSESASLWAEAAAADGAGLEPGKKEKNKTSIN